MPLRFTCGGIGGRGASPKSDAHCATISGVAKRPGVVDDLLTKKELKKVSEIKKGKCIKEI